MKNLFIATKLKLNAFIVFLGLVVLAVITYYNVNHLKKNYEEAKYVSDQVSHYKSVLVGGLLVNSASGVFANDPEGKKPLKTIDMGIKSVEKFYKQIDSKNDKVFQDFLQVSKSALSFAKTNQYLDPQQLKKILKVWRPLKFDIQKRVKQFNQEKSVLDKDFQNIVTSLLTSILTVIAIVTVIIVLFNYILSKGIIDSIEELEKSMKNLSEGKVSDTLKLHNNDEVKKVAEYFNIYMENIKKGLEQDNKVIEEVRLVIKKVKSGLLDESVKQKANSTEVQSLVDELNSMIKITSDNLHQLSQALIAYSNSKFNYPVQHVEGLTGLVASMFWGVKATGSTVQELLALIDNSNKRLLFGSKELTKSSANLSNASNEQAASLEETSAAIQEVTSTMVESSKNTMLMDKEAKNVLNSLQSGEKLAKQTAQSMDDINKQVTAITEAIGVIDQISFQTNILSLNAAVEAATAGEAGKGFAVVAGEVRNLASRSAEAANEIKAIVENATTKANSGKSIADQMIGGYGDLTKSVQTTTELIDKVSNATRSQEASMKQINDAINSIDHTTQQNAHEATKISEMANENEKLATLLQSAIDLTEFDEKAKRRVCDIDMIFETTKLKLTHINFKDEAFKKAAQGESYKVESHNQCILGKWIEKNETTSYGKSGEFNILKNAHIDFHNKIQTVVDLHSKKGTEDEIIKVANQVEENIGTVFEKLDTIREVNCDNLLNK